MLWIVGRNVSTLNCVIHLIKGIGTFLKKKIFNSNILKNKSESYKIPIIILIILKIMRTLCP